MASDAASRRLGFAQLRQIAGFLSDRFNCFGKFAGLLAAIHADPAIFADRRKLAAAVRFANAVGALTTTERGAIPALPRRERVEAALRN